MKEKTKNEWIQVRVTSTEKVEIKALAKKNGFDSVSTYLLWLLRKK